MSATRAVIRNGRSSSPRSRRGDPAWEVALLWPRQGEWTEEEYLALDPQRPVELVDGCLEVLPMPTAWHQLILQFLYEQIIAYVRQHDLGGYVITSNSPVRVLPGTLRQPDVFYATEKQLPDLSQPAKGAELAVEILSPGEGNRRRDLLVKRAEYARARIPEYWIVDPAKETVMVLVRSGRRYREHGTFHRGETANSVRFRGLAVPVSELFRRGPR